MNINKLSGADLDLEVAKCEGFTDYDPTTGTMLPPREEYGRVILCDNDFSTNWELGGSIIEREGIQLARLGDVWEAWVDADGVFCQGPTPLIAAMRCYVASKQGESNE